MATYGQRIDDLATGEWETLERRLVHGGSLQARRLKTGSVQLYWRFSHKGKTHREPIGPYDSSAPPKKREPGPKGWGVTAAIERCRELAEAHRGHVGGLHAVKDEKERAHAAKEAAHAERASKTLEGLLATYVSYLKAQKRRSWYDAEQIFRLHVLAPFPKVAAKPAADVTPDEILDMLRRLIEAGKGRSANKLRSYVRAAFQCAIDVRTTASIPIAFKAFAVVFNPAAQTKRDSQFDRADKHPLSVADLRQYWNRIRALDGLPGAALRIHLLSGGQRIEQLVRLRWPDVHEDSLTIYDSKGRPGHGARPHLLPVITPLAKTLDGLEREGAYVISTTHGLKPVSATTLGNWARHAVDGTIPDFQLKRIRSGVETVLAANGISRDVRGYLQSHGLTGVQARHYDGHDYMPQKRQALELLFDLLDNQPRQKVLPIKRRRA